MKFAPLCLWLPLAALGLHSQAHTQTCHQRVEHVLSSTSTQFGISVDLQADICAIGARKDNAGGTVHLFQENPASKAFLFTGTIQGSDTTTSDDFGESVCIDGNRLVVGAPGADGGVGHSGQVYVFERILGTTDWIEQDIVYPAVNMFTYGRDVAIDGDRMVVGVENSASVICYEYNAGTGQWDETQILAPTDLGPASRFGEGVAMSQGRLVVGAWGTNIAGVEGMALVYAFNAGTGLWEEEQRLQGDGVVVFNANFGSSVDIDGDRLIVGQSTRHTGSVSAAGAGFVYDWDTGSGLWELTQVLETNAPEQNAYMGRSVAISGDLAALGAPFTPVPGTSFTGAIHRFRLDSGSQTWIEEPVTLLPPDYEGNQWPQTIAVDSGVTAGGDLREAFFLRDDSPDCNGNGIGDLCEISAGTAPDNNINGVLDVCETIGFSYCDPAVPASNGLPAVTVALGSDSATLNEFSLATFDMPLNRFAYYIGSQGTFIVNQPSGSQGNLCIAGSAIGRFNQVKNILNSGTTGTVTLNVDLTAMAQPTGPVPILAGETWYFQLWFRDFNPTSTSNFSNAQGVLFQ